MNYSLAQGILNICYLYSLSSTEHGAYWTYVTCTLSAPLSMGHTEHIYLYSQSSSEHGAYWTYVTYTLSVPLNMGHTEHRLPVLSAPLSMGLWIFLPVLSQLHWTWGILNLSIRTLSAARRMGHTKHIYLYSPVLSMTLNCIQIFIVTYRFLYWSVMTPASQRFFIHSCIHLRILIISYLATFLCTNSLCVLMCRKAVNQSINQLPVLSQIHWAYLIDLDDAYDDCVGSVCWL